MPPTATLGDLRAKVHSEAQSLLLNKWEVEGCIYPKPEAIGIAAGKGEFLMLPAVIDISCIDTHGFTAFETNSTRIRDICPTSEPFYALVPSQSAGAILPDQYVLKLPEYLTAPLHQKLKKEQEEKVELRAQHHAMQEMINAIVEQAREKDKQVNELKKCVEELVERESEKEKREGEDSFLGSV